LWAPPPVHEPDAAPSGEGTPAVVLQQRPDARGRIELLLRSAVAWGRGVRRFRLGEQWWSLVFEETLEEGAGFRRVQARLLS
jgi:hypothetical protein